ncbi:LamG-like jellyroll fold domain-containing protein [Nonomuraea sp. 3N208]|uniref:LamG-like jellyroll fold domain-containing protein n=1 Tax=Nonomuraea sp. 3N208 TaxID=3457421 RepID=UPI003FD49C0D
MLQPGRPTWWRDAAWWTTSREPRKTSAAIVVPPGPDAEAGSVESAVPIPLDAYTHIAATFDGKIATLYVNGRQRGSARPAYTGMSLGGRRPL